MTFTFPFEMRQRLAADGMVAKLQEDLAECNMAKVCINIFLLASNGKQHITDMPGNDDS